ncbi:unnamed protein product [Lactuca virosa]|uniref:Uncharacterized protein n=1 Tax=Lactuca virosa TaxID=75947 RepID=A0AAU9NTY6_9ASTR|nr:unnamed protein product [Lactuca virosa]
MSKLLMTTGFRASSGISKRKSTSLFWRTTCSETIYLNGLQLDLHILDCGRIIHLNVRVERVPYKNLITKDCGRIIHLNVRVERVPYKNLITKGNKHPV